MNRVRLTLFTINDEYVSDEDFDGYPQKNDILEIKGYGYRFMYYKWRQMKDGVFRQIGIVKKL